MIQSLKARWATIAVVMVLGVIWTVPNFVDVSKFWWPSSNKIVMGLDIQGGSHLVLQVDMQGAIRQDATRIANEIQQELTEDGVTVESATVGDPDRGEIRIELNQAVDQEKVTAFIDRTYGDTFQIAESQPSHVTLEFSELYVRDFRRNLLDQAIATIRNRIDEFGVSEPSITAQGENRILVQLPGIKDAATAKELINRTARLDFMIVSTDVQQAELETMIQEAEAAHGLNLRELNYTKYVDRLNEVLKDKLPANTVVYFEKPENAATLEAGRLPYLLRIDEAVSGSRLTNASVSLDEFGRPIVQFRFDAAGTRQFADLTRKHSRQQMAIVLDRVITSAPVINEPITGGSGQITLGSGRDQQTMLNEAKLIATALRAGALPASLEQLEERTVGPSLGRDAVEKGEVATLIAMAVVFLFMLIYYRTFGLVANISLALNLFLLIAVLSSLGATLTLPGIAGMALTIGMAVDANVIIYERIREEMRKGASLVASVREGYEKAFSSIFDANVTTIIVCVVLMYYGTGPVRGFAVTLMTGLIISMFTAVFFTRAVFDLLVAKWKWRISV